MPGPQRTADGGRRSDDAGGLYPVGTVSRLLDDICDTEDALTFLLLVLQPLCLSKSWVRDGLIARSRLRGSDSGVSWVSGTCFHPSVLPPRVLPGSHDLHRASKEKKSPRKSPDSGSHDGPRMVQERCKTRGSLTFLERGSRGGGKSSTRTNKRAYMSSVLLAQGGLDWE